MTSFEESRLLQNLSNLHRFDARDIADLTFLYLIALHILRCDFDHADWAKQYAVRSLSTDWYLNRAGGTDLYQMLHVLFTHANASNFKNSTKSGTLLRDITLDRNHVTQFLRNITHHPYNNDQASRLLLRFEQSLRIQNSNYRSVRRIAADWDSAVVTTEAKSLAVTRLLQALQHRASRSDILLPVQQMAKTENLLLTAACNPETGFGCEPAKGSSLLGTVAKAAGLTVGAYLLGKALFSK